MDGVQLSQGYRATSRRQFTFYHSFPKISWYSFIRPGKDERLSQPWCHPMLLNLGPLDWESSTLTTRPLLHDMQKPCMPNDMQKIKFISYSFLLTYTLQSLWIYLTTPTWNDWRNLQLLWAPKYMQKINFKAQLFLEMKLTHYFV